MPMPGQKREKWTKNRSTSKSHISKSFSVSSRSNHDSVPDAMNRTVVTDENEEVDRNATFIKKVAFKAAEDGSECNEEPGSAIDEDLEDTE